MQSTIARLFLYDQDSDDQFLEMLQDSSKQQERLRRLEENRIWAIRALVVGLVLAMFVVALALFGTNTNIDYFGMALAAVIILDARAQYSSADVRIKLIKLYSLMTQKP